MAQFYFRLQVRNYSNCLVAQRSLSVTLVSQDIEICFPAYHKEAKFRPERVQREAPLPFFTVKLSVSESIRSILETVQDRMFFSIN